MLGRGPRRLDRRSDSRHPRSSRRQGMSMIKAILFDKDGTLLDFKATWLSFTRELAEAATDGDTAAGRCPAVDGSVLIRRPTRFRPNSVVAAGTNADVVRHFVQQAWKASRFGRMVNERATASPADIAGRAIPLPGAMEAVRALHKSGIVLGIATNDSTSGAEKTMAGLWHVRRCSISCLRLRRCRQPQTGAGCAFGLCRTGWRPPIGSGHGRRQPAMILKWPEQAVRAWRSACFRAPGHVRRWRRSPMSFWIRWLRSAGYFGVPLA